jgi:hypothetical protein
LISIFCTLSQDGVVRWFAFSSSFLDGPDYLTDGVAVTLTNFLSQDSFLVLLIDE